MIAKQLYSTLCAGLLGLISLSACAPAPSSTLAAQGGDATPTAELRGTEAAAPEGAATSSAAATAVVDEGVASNVTATGDGVTTAVAAPQDQPGQTQPGAGADSAQPGAGASSGGSAGATSEESGAALPGSMLTYADPLYGFQLAYPGGFVLSETPAEQLAQWLPAPLAGHRFMNPQTGASDIVELEPADLEIRVHTLPSGVELAQWLVANSLLPADGSVTPAPFAAANVDGLELCASTMIAVGCSYFFVGGDYIYQLIPATLEGEEMMRSFALTD